MGQLVTIQLNGSSFEIADGTSVIDLLEAKEINPLQVVVEWNLNILKATQLNTTLLKKGDTVEVLRFVGGG